MKHTPGPWWVDGKAGYSAPIIMAGDPWPGKSRQIAKVLYEEGSKDREVDANADLITMAWLIPELVEALDKAREWMCPPVASEVYDDIAFAEAVELVADVLAKAKGGSNG